MKKIILPLVKIYQIVFRSSFLLNLFSVGGASIVSKLIGLIIIGYPARILGPESFGMIGFGTSLVAYASILIIPGIAVSQINFSAKSQILSNFRGGGDDVF